MSKKMFEGVRVIDFGNNVAGPLCGAMLADFGADVIKVEKPILGDDSHGFTPYVEGKSLTNLWLNRGKRSIVLDVKNPEGKRLFKELLKTADVLIESFKPGVMARLGLSWEDLHPEFPNLIMYSASAFGQNGPYKDLPGYDMIAQAVSGLIDTTGYAEYPAVKIGPSICDYACAYNGFGAIAGALFYRERGGEAQHIDIALAECGLAMNDHTELAISDPTVHRAGNHHVILGPYGIFNAKGDSIALAALNPKLWEILCNLMGKPELINDPDLDTSGKRAIPENCSRVVKEIEGWLETLPNMDEAQRILREAGIPCAKITKLKDLQYDKHFIEREMIIDFPTPQLSTPTVKARGEHIHMSATPAVIGPGPELNQHAEEILRGVLKLDQDEIHNLICAGAFGKQYEVK